MEKRYQVFVSSTYKDLQKERQEVMHALLELDCMPSGMELFPAANESQWSLIKKVIDDCDYYVLILGGRYGSCGPDGLSYTEMEYRYALSIGKPTVSFLHRDPGSIPSKNCESTQEGIDKLAAFREFVEEKLCKHWANPAELGSVVSRSLIQLIKTTPAVGWIRADELPTKDATIELLKLRQNVEDLQSELASVRTTAPKGSENLAQGEERQLFKFSYSFQTKGDYRDHAGGNTFKPTWNEVFGVLAPLMINEASDAGLKEAMGDFASDQNKEKLQREYDYGTTLKYFTMNDTDWQTIKVQLRSLGLIAKSEKPRSIKDTSTYWALTPYGDEVMIRLRAIKRKTPPKTKKKVAKKKVAKK
ncbi:MAG: DUF4062 domain-containing protein [Planctomycetes bacterium]|nr:DUF4062 domain-containing protein [Planctomycetota bacterium]